MEAIFQEIGEISKERKKDIINSVLEYIRYVRRMTEDRLPKTVMVLDQTMEDLEIHGFKK